MSYLNDEDRDRDQKEKQEKSVRSIQDKLRTMQAMIKKLIKSKK